MSSEKQSREPAFDLSKTEVPINLEETVSELFPGLTIDDAPGKRAAELVLDFINRPGKADGACDAAITVTAAIDFYGHLYGGNNGVPTKSERFREAADHARALTLSNAKFAPWRTNLVAAAAVAAFRQALEPQAQES
jgi:hypothetical protein